MNKGLNDIFTFDKDYDTAEYVTDLQNTINKLYDLVNHAGDFVSDDVADKNNPIWEYVTEEKDKNTILYVILNLLDKSDDVELTQRINDIIFASMNK